MNRKTIAVLMDHMNFFGAGFEVELRDALHLRSKSLGTNLLLMYGRAIDEPYPWRAAHNAIFERIRPESVDGVIAVGSLLALHSSADGMRRLMERYRPQPSCSLGALVPGIPSVVVNDRAGMGAVVDHLIVEHGCRRLAFIGGPPEHPDAISRLEGYQSALQRHGLELDPALCAHGHFSRNLGNAAMQEILGRGIAFDGVVAANDWMALGAIDALRAQGRRIPRDLPVTGLDDLMFARLGNPPLTSVAQPFATMAEAALRSVLDQIAGREVPPVVTLEMEFMRRRSCGCGGRPAQRKSVPVSQEWSATAYLRANAERIRASLSALVDAGSRVGSQDAGRLFDALVAQLDGQADAFIVALEDLIEDSADDDARFHALETAISWLREELRALRTLEQDDLWCEALSLIGLANTSAQMQHRATLDESYRKLLGVGERLSTVFDFESLQAVLEKTLPAAGIGTAFVSRYVDGGTSLLQPLVSLKAGAALERTAVPFPDWQFYPPRAYPDGYRHTSLVFPLVFEAERLGVAVFEYVPGTNGYPVLREQLSAALRTIALHQEVVQKTKLHERSVQERVATSKRMSALSLLAGGVAHDLNNALGPLVALPDAILRELDAQALPAGVLAEMRADVEAIKSATLRAVDTIKDLLTLGQQGRSVREPMDLKRVVEESVQQYSRPVLRDANRKVKFSLELTPEALFIRGCAPHVARAVTNLVHNAFDAIEGEGEVTLTARAVHLAQALTRYETIEPGRYCVLSVTDTGSGIAPQDISRLFEPYFSKKALGETSGSGLGLAIVHGVVKEHGGYIDVSSSVGIGTRFALYFPRADDVAEAVERSTPVPPTSRRGARILVVDDEAIQLRTGRRVLSLLGYKVDTLTSGQRAYELFRAAAPSGKSPYDLVILDMLLNEPEDGLQLFERIQHVFPEQRAIVASGQARSARADRAIARGVAWLGKPYTTDALATAVEAVLNTAPGP